MVVRENGQKLGSLELVAEAKDVAQSPTPATHVRAELDVPAQGLHRAFDSADKRKRPSRPDMDDNMVPVSIYTVENTRNSIFFTTSGKSVIFFPVRVIRRAPEKTIFPRILHTIFTILLKKILSLQINNNRNLKYNKNKRACTRTSTAFYRSFIAVLSICIGIVAINLTDYHYYSRTSFVETSII